MTTQRTATSRACESRPTVAPSAAFSRVMVAGVAVILTAAVVVTQAVASEQTVGHHQGLRSLR